MITLPTGRWRNAPAVTGSGGIGLLVLDGLLVRRVGIEGRFGAELLGEGDLLRPWEGEEDLPTLPLTTAWRVLETARLAVLDEAFMGHLADYPQLGGRLVGRALARSRNIAVNMAIVHQARVDVRLHMLFWHLASRWGRVGSGAVTVPLRLTHAVLAELAAARRPDGDQRAHGSRPARAGALDRGRLGAHRRASGRARRRRAARRALDRLNTAPGL